MGFWVDVGHQKDQVTREWELFSSTPDPQSEGQGVLETLNSIKTHEREVSDGSKLVNTVKHREGGVPQLHTDFCSGSVWTLPCVSLYMAVHVSPL